MSERREATGDVEETRATARRGGKDSTGRRPLARVVEAEPGAGAQPPLPLVDRIPLASRGDPWSSTVVMGELSYAEWVAFYRAQEPESLSALLRRGDTLAYAWARARVYGLAARAYREQELAARGRLGPETEWGRATPTVVIERTYPAGEETPFAVGQQLRSPVQLGLVLTVLRVSELPRGVGAPAWEGTGPEGEPEAEDTCTTTAYCRVATAREVKAFLAAERARPEPEVRRPVRVWRRVQRTLVEDPQGAAEHFSREVIAAALAAVAQEADR